MINIFLYYHSMLNGIDQNMVQHFDEKITVRFLIVKLFNIDNMNCNWNIEYENKWGQSIKYNVVIDKWVHWYKNDTFFIAEVKQTITLSPWKKCDSNKMPIMFKQFERVINKLGVGKDWFNIPDNIINNSICR